MFEKISSLFKSREKNSKLEVSINTNDVTNSTFTQNIIVIGEDQLHNIQDILSDTNNDDFNNSDSLLNSLLKNNLTSIKKYLSDRNFLQAEYELNPIINHVNFNKIIDDIKSEYLFIQGQIYIEKGQMERAEDILSCLSDYKKKRAFLDLEMKLLAVKKDKNLINEYIEKLQKSNVEVEEIILRKGYFKIVTEEYKEALEKLYPENTVIESLENRQEYHYYIGIVFYNLGNIELAEKFLTKSNIIHKTIYKDFLLILCKIRPIFENEKLTFKKSNTQSEELLASSLNSLLSYEEYFKNETKGNQELFYNALFNIFLYIDPQEVIKKIESITRSIISSDILTLYLGEANFLLKNFEAALREYRLLDYSKHLLLTERIYICLFELGYYHELINEFETNSNNKPNDESFILELYIRACNKYYDEEEFDERIKFLEGSYSDISWIFNVVLLQLKKDANYLNNLLILSNDFDEKTVYFVSIELLKLKYYDEALLMLEKFKLTSEEHLKLFIEIAISNNEIDSKQPFIELLLDSPIRLEECWKNYLLANLYFLEKDYLATVEYYEKISIKDTELFNKRKIAYEVLASKLNVNDSTNVDIYIEILKDSVDPHHLMIAAVAIKDLLKDFYNALSLAYKSLLILKGKFDPIIYWNYISFFMPYISLYSDETLITKEIKNVTFDCIIYLRNVVNNNLFKVCIHSSLSGLSEYILDSGTRHVEVGSIEDILLRKKSVDDVVQIDSVDYKITKINNKYYDKYIECWKKYNDEDFPDKKLKSIPIDENDTLSFIEKIKAILPKVDYQKNLNSNYYKGKIPLIILCQGNYRKMHALISWLLSSRKDKLLAGISQKVFDGEKIVFSLSSILFLEIIGALRYIKKLNIDIFVPKSTIVFVEKMFQEVLNNENSKATMFLDGENNLKIIEISEEEKLQEINFWRNVLTFVQQVNNKSVYKRIVPLLKDYDIDLEIDSINLAHDLQATYISEDNFFKKFFMSDNKLKVTNSIVLIDMLLEMNLIDFNFYIKKLRILDESNYLSYKSTNQLIIVTEHLLKAPKRLLFQVSPELMEFENLLYKYLIREKVLLFNLYLVQRILSYLYGAGDFENSLPIIKSIFNSLSKASETLHSNPFVLPSITAYYLKQKYGME